MDFFKHENDNLADWEPLNFPSKLDVRVKGTSYPAGKWTKKQLATKLFQLAPKIMNFSGIGENELTDYPSSLRRGGGRKKTKKRRRSSRKKKRVSSRKRTKKRLRR